MASRTLATYAVDYSIGISWHSRSTVWSVLTDAAAKNGPDELRRTVAEAWVRATDGVLSEATALLSDYAASARRSGCPAHEVWRLQIATQFGDPGGADR